MIQIDLSLYVYTLYILIILSISVFILIIRKIDSDEISVLSLRYFNRYFILGVLGWLLLLIKENVNININMELSIYISIYCFASCFLLIAIAESDKQNKLQRQIAILVHVFIAAIIFLLNSDSHRIIFVVAYSGVVYFYISYITFKRARQKRNMGHAIIGGTALCVVLLVPFQFYVMLIFQDFTLAYGISFIGAVVGFVLFGIGVLTTVLIAENTKLKRLALYDPLTGLYNRRGMDFSLNHSVASTYRSGECISAINIDIDFFKKVNDTHGHDGGDFVLQKISETLLQNVRPKDVCSRLGGEEFVIVLPDTSQHYAISVAERIRVDIEALELIYMDKKIKLTSSFGVATHCKSIDIDYLLKDADKALYAAKAEGRNKVCVAASDQ